MRYSDRPFPPYTYVPGKAPHPRSDPDGHAFGLPEPYVESFDPDKWQESCAYRLGVDLFNAGFYWESHEQWEAVWHAVGRKGSTADFLKGLIKLAAAYVKSNEENLAGVQRHGARAAGLFRAVAESNSAMAGLNLDELIEVARQLGSAKTAPPAITLELRPWIQA